jgi:hypothetical protein
MVVPPTMLLCRKTHRIDTSLTLMERDNGVMQTSLRKYNERVIQAANHDMMM